MDNFWSCMSFYLVGSCVCAPPRLDLALGKWDTKPKRAFLSKRKKRDFSSKEINIFYICTITLRKGWFLARWICFFFSSSEANTWNNYWNPLLHVVSFIHLLKVCKWNKSGDVWNFGFGRVLPNAVVKMRMLSRWTGQEWMFLSAETTTPSMGQIFSFAANCGELLSSVNKPVWVYLQSWWWSSVGDSVGGF